MGRFIDLTNEKFGKLEVIKRVKNNKRGKAKWLCKCDCGNVTVVRGDNLRNGHTRSCGCLIGETVTKRQLKHGLSKHPLYNVWYSMVDRCNNPNCDGYKNYGGRSIKVWEEWENNFLSFYEWAVKNGWRESLTIDRIDNNIGYFPQNVRFVTIKENVRNKGNLKLTKEKADKIRSEYKKNVVGYKMLGRKYNTHWSNVRNVIKRGQWQ